MLKRGHEGQGQDVEAGAWTVGHLAHACERQPLAVKPSSVLWRCQATVAAAEPVPYPQP